MWDAFSTRLLGEESLPRASVRQRTQRPAPSLFLACLTDSAQIDMVVSKVAIGPPRRSRRPPTQMMFCQAPCGYSRLEGLKNCNLEIPSGKHAMPHTEGGECLNRELKHLHG